MEALVVELDAEKKWKRAKKAQKKGRTLST